MDNTETSHIYSIILLQHIYSIIATHLQLYYSTSTAEITKTRGMECWVELNVIRYKKLNINMTIECTTVLLWLNMSMAASNISLSSPLRFHKISSIGRRLNNNNLHTFGIHRVNCILGENHSYLELVSLEHPLEHTAHGKICNEFVMNWSLLYPLTSHWVELNLYKLDSHFLVVLSATKNDPDLMYHRNN